MRSCTLCNSHIPEELNAKAKYCGKKCSRKASRDTKKPCSVEGCTRNKRARGVCSAHYNEKYQTSRHVKVMVPCFICDTPTLKYSSTGKSRASVCSNECKKIVTFGTPLPEDHWARWWGKTSKWTAPGPEKVTAPTFISNNCDDCGATFVELNNHNVSKYCSERCGKRVARRIRKAREYNSTGTFRWVEVIKLWMAAGKRCSYCDQTMTGQPDPDHVVPISRGGRNDLGNIVPCCRQCNGDKGDQTLDEWADERARLGKPALRYSLPFNDPRFKHLTLGEAKGISHRKALALAA